MLRSIDFSPIQSISIGFGNGENSNLIALKIDSGEIESKLLHQQRADKRKQSSCYVAVVPFR